MADWILAAAAVASLVLLWQQNRILSRQGPAAPEKPEMRRYWPMLAMFLMMCGIWAAVSVDIYIRDHRARKWSDNMVVIWTKTYEDQTVQLDGYDYEDCTFKNVSFDYEGTGPTRIINGHPSGSIRVVSRDFLVNQVLDIAAAEDRLKGIDNNFTCSELPPTPAP
jgi:hypothetical protein